MNIAHFIGFPIDYNGNLQRALYEAINVAKLGTKVDFVVSEDIVQDGTLSKSIPNRQIRLDKFHVYTIKPLVRQGSVGWRLNNFLSLQIGAMPIVEHNKIDILHVHAPTPVVKPLALALTKQIKKKRMVVDLHDPWSGYPFSKSPGKLIQTSIMRYVLNKADFIVAAHSALLELVKKINNKKPTALLPNCVDTEVFKPKSFSLDLFKKLNLSESDHVIAFAGHITEEKGLDTLVDAAKTVTKKFENVKFVIIGDGPLRSKIESSIKRNFLTKFFRFTGFIETSLLSDYLSLAEICVCPYKKMAHYEVMKIETPLKVVQYLSMGKPVVMSSVSTENVVKWSGGGILVNPDQPEALADGLIGLLNDKSSRLQMGIKGRKYVVKNLSWAQAAAKLNQIYAEVNH